MQTIRSISGSQHQILKWIQTLYCKNGYDVDPFYGAGGFYPKQKSLFGKGIRGPLFYSDLYRSKDGAWKADARALPIKTGSVKSIILDPPFLAGGGKGSNMAAKYGVAGEQNHPVAVWDLYKACMDEGYRVLKKFGYMVVKCQDLLHGRTNYLTHIEIVNYAVSLGMYPADIFLCQAKSRPRAWNHQSQNTARKFHSYFLVFGKQVRTVGYMNEPTRKDKYGWVKKEKLYEMFVCPICGKKRKINGKKAIFLNGRWSCISHMEGTQIGNKKFKYTGQ